MTRCRAIWQLSSRLPHQSLTKARSIDILIFAEYFSGGSLRVSALHITYDGHKPVTGHPDRPDGKELRCAAKPAKTAPSPSHKDRRATDRTTCDRYQTHICRPRRHPRDRDCRWAMAPSWRGTHADLWSRRWRHTFRPYVTSPLGGVIVNRAATCRA